MQADIDPLTPELWFERLEMIANGRLGSIENALRHAFHLLQLTPREFRPPEYWALDEESYEALLEAGDLDAAARCLVEAPTLTVTSALGAGGVKVAIKCERLGNTIFGEGNSTAAAIVQAWAKCFLTMRSEFGLSQFKQAIVN